LFQVNASAVSPLVKCAPRPTCRKERQPWLTGAGNRIADNQNSVTAGPMGPYTEQQENY